VHVSLAYILTYPLPVRLGETCLLNVTPHRLSPVEGAPLNLNAREDLPNGLPGRLLEVEYHALDIDPSQPLKQTTQNLKKTVMHVQLQFDRVFVCLCN